MSEATALPDSAEHRTVATNGVELHVVLAGPADGDPVVLLHGFPEFWYGWRHQLPALADAGYRVVVPDQRGYNRSEKPEGVDAYRIDEIAADAVGLLDALGHDSARFVGHDWGAATLWQVLLRHPGRVDRAVAMDVPHPETFEAYVPGNPRQLRRSWYMLYYQLPALPEWSLRALDWRGLRWFIDTSNRPGTFTPTELERYRDAWSRPGALTAMLNWYRALVRVAPPDPPSWTVDPPTLVLWGEEDSFLLPEMAADSADHCRNGRAELVPDASHWLHHEVPDRVNDAVLSFFAD